MRLADLRDRLRTTLWFIPSLCVVAALVLVWITDQIDKSFPDLRESVRVVGSNDSAETVLTTIATSMISLTALVFSITVVVLQLASTQFSPRVLRTFLRDRRSQFALGVFVATFVYSLVTLRSVGTQSADFIPQISVGAAFALVLLSLGVFVMYINNIAQSIRVASIVKSIGDETRDMIEELYPRDRSVPDVTWARPPRAHHFYGSSKGGVMIGVDEDELVAWAREHDCVLELLQGIGDFVPKGQRILARYGGGPGPLPLDPSDFISVAHERTMRQDIAFGFRQLVDIAERALSPAINDPTTAVQSIDQMHDLLRRLADRPFPGPYRLDVDGDVRLVMQAMRWEGYVSLAMDEIRQYEGRSLQVARRFRAMINDLLIVVDDDRRGVLERELELLDEAVRRQFPDEDDRRTAARPDEQGMGY